MRNRARLLFTGVISITAIACGPSSAGGPPLPTIPDKDAPGLPKPINTAVASWKLQPSSADHLYFTTSDVHLKLTDSSTIPDELITNRAEFHFSSSREGRGFILSAAVNDFSLQGGQKTGISTTSFPLPLSVTGHLQNNKLLFTLAGTATTVDCTNPASAALSAIQRTFVTPPVDLHTGMSWIDSITAETCSAGLPVISQNSRNYRVLGESAIGTVPVILLERHDRSSSAGEGSNGQHRVAVQTETIGSGQVAIDRMTGSLVNDASTYTTSITIRSSGRIQKFTQIVKEQIALK